LKGIVVVELTLNLPGGMWQRIRDVRNRVAEASAHLPVEMRDAAVMVTGELLENAVKYGACVPDSSDIVVRYSIDEGRVSIVVQNGVASRAAFDEVAARIAQIAASEDREALYIARLQEMLRSHSAGGGLGLYRIGFEGRFDLTCECIGQVLTVKATRELP
jgi:hypothetical protein